MSVKFSIDKFKVNSDFDIKLVTKRLFFSVFENYIVESSISIF